MIPQINRFITDPKKQSVMVPQCYFADDDVGVLIMEDLRLKGYTVGDKKKGKQLV